MVVLKCPYNIVQPVLPLSNIYQEAITARGI